jgi:SET domain-containing protein
MGLFAVQPIAAGERVIEYKGELTIWRHAAVRQRSKRWPHVRIRPV